MNFVNLIKSFKFENQNLQFSFYNSEDSERELTIQPMDESAKAFLKNEENYSRTVDHIYETFIDRIEI